MSEATYRITLDIQDERSRDRLVVRKGDDRRKVYISLVDGGVPYQLTGEQLVTFAAARPDGETVYAEPEVDLDKIVLVLGSQVTEVVGRVRGELQIYAEDGSLVSTPRFDIIVDDTVYHEGDEIATPLRKTRVLLSPADAYVGQYLEVEEVDDGGRVVKLKAVDAPEGTSSGAGLVIRARDAEVMEVDLSKYPIGNSTMIIFEKGTYHVAPFDLNDRHHVTFFLGDATIVCQGAYFLKASGCDHLRIEGGRIEGTAQTEVGVELYDCKFLRAVRMSVANIGREHTVGAKGIQITGDCSGFLLDQCDISDIHSGQVSDPETDDWIHAYGVVINRAQNTEKYSKSGVIRSCAFRQVAGIDQVDDSGAVTKQADGDGIFIHQFPCYDADGKLVRTDPNILIEGCSFEGCKKRGVKANSRGVTVRRCRFEGDFWLGPVEFQQGYGLIEDCHLVNTTQQTGGSVAGIVLDEGGVTIRDCFISCPYSGGYHDGIVMDGRIETDPVAVSEPWDLITVERCRFDGVSRALVAGAGSGDATGYHLRGIHVVDCRFGLVTGNYPVHISKGRFGSIDSLRMVDYRFDLGQNKGAINAAIGELTGTTGVFKYPILYGLVPTGQLHLWSAYYLDSPTVSYGDSLPVDGAAPDTRIVYYNLGNIKYAERNAWQTRYWGPIQTDPAKLTASQTVDMLKAARPGDVFTSTATGDVYICTKAGTAGSDGVGASSGTWAKVSATVVSATEVT